MSKESKTYKPIGTTVYAIYKERLERQDKNGTTLMICRIKTYKNIKGVITPVLSQVGDSKHTITAGYEIFYDLDKALKALGNSK